MNQTLEKREKTHFGPNLGFCAQFFFFQKSGFVTH